jgi:uncharacterized repeat protein (TIGR01451 family)
MNFVGLQTGRNTRSSPSQVASRRNRARYRLAAQTLEQCENRVLLATILGAAQSFAVLGASTVTNTGASAIVGNVGVSPGTATTGFPPGTITGGALQAGNALAAQAHADLVTAYGEIAGEVSPPANDLTGTNLGGLTLAPGVYHFDTSASLAEATTLTLNANGDPNARFDFQIGTTLITGSTSAIKLINGAEAQNVYFQVGSSATLGTGTLFEGNILADQSVTLTTGATMVDGRALALVGAVTMDTNQVTQPPEADLSLTKTASAGPALPGNDITYTITVANAGPDAAQAVAMTDDVPLNTTFVSDAQMTGPTFTLTNPTVGGTGTITGTIATLAGGASATFTVVFMVSPTAPDATIITNTADVFSTVTYDPNLANNTQTVTTDVAASADLSLTKTASAGPVLPGDDITYTITVANAGLAAAQAVAMTDDVPLNTTFVSEAQTSGPTFTLTNPAVGGTGAITGTIATLANGASATFTVVVMVLPSTPDGTMITNTADVLSTVTHDPNLANNTQTVTTHVGTNADVQVTKTAAAGPVLAGNDITYTITVVNTGPSGAQTVALTDPLPADTTFVSDTQTTGLPFTMTGPAVGGTGTISDTIATLPLGDSASFTVVVLVSPSTPDLTAITNTATVTSTTSTNSASATNVATHVMPAMPVVMDVQRFGFHDQATDLVVFFNTPLAAAQAQDLDNYRIVTLGGPGRGGSLIGHVTRVRKAVYNAAAGTVTLYMAHRLDIHNRYRFTIAGAAPDGLMGTDGVHLDGAANGIAGSDYVTEITEKTLAGRASEATRASLTYEFGVKKVAHAISASAVDMLAVSGQLASRTASAHH